MTAIYRVNLQHFFRQPIGKVQHNGHGHAVYDRFDFAMGFVETIGVKVLKHQEDDGFHWIWAKDDNRYALNHLLEFIGEKINADAN